MTYNKERESCERGTTVARVEEQLRKLTGQPWTLRVESSGVAASTELAEASRPPAAPWRNLREEAEQVPLVRRALEVLNAQIVRVDEGFGLLPGEENGEHGNSPAPDEES